MGTIKQRNPALYYGLVNKVEQSPDYALRKSAFKYDGRAVSDINEEIFVSKFGEYFSNTVIDPWLKQNSNDLEELGKEYKEGA